MKHVRYRSERLSRFWGRDVYLGAIVLVPEGWDTHPNQRYPLVLSHGHFEREMSGWRETPPDPAFARDRGREPVTVRTPSTILCRKHGYERLGRGPAALPPAWTSASFPRCLLVQIAAGESVLRRLATR